MSDDSANAVPADDGVSVGSHLKQARVAKGLSLEQAAEEMRLSPDVLDALEGDRFDILGAQVFVRGHLRQYGQLLGLDADELMQRYSAQDHPSDDPIVGTEPIRVTEQVELKVWIALAVLVVMLALLVWWWASPDDNSADSAARPVESAEPAPAPVAGEELPTAQPRALEIETTPAELVGSEPGPDVDVVTPAPLDVEPVADETAPRIAETFSVEVTFDEDCWAEIIGGDDRRLFYGLGRAGARSRFEARLPMSVLLGNVDGVRIAINGAAYSIPVGSRQGNLARFVIVDYE